MRTSSDGFQLWNFELSESVRSWTEIKLSEIWTDEEKFAEMVAFSDGRVVSAEKVGNFGNVGNVFILDTTDDYEVSTITDDEEFITCNTKGQLITFDYSSH